MAMNLQKMKKYVVLFTVGFFPLLMFVLPTAIGWGLLFSGLFSVLGIVIGILVFNKFMTNPLTMLLEGAGILILTFDSTGRIEPYIARVREPFLDSEIRGQKFGTVFDRNTLFHLKAPREAVIDKSTADEKGITTLTMKYKQGEENTLNYAFMQYPTMIYNKNMEAFLTKNSLAKMESESIMRHQLLYLKKKTEELTDAMRDFGRYVIEVGLRPKANFLSGLLGNKWLWIALLIIIGGFLLLQGGGGDLLGGAQETVTGATTGSNPIVGTRP